MSEDARRSPTRKYNWTPETLEGEFGTYRADNYPGGPPFYSGKREAAAVLLLVFALVSIPVGSHFYDTNLFHAAMEDRDIILIVGDEQQWSPSSITLQMGKTYVIRVLAEDVSHGFMLLDPDGDQVVELVSAPGEIVEFEFHPGTPGRYLFFCTVYCGVEHGCMAGSITVVP